MSDRNWEAELAKIDKQLASVSDDQLLADRKALAAGKPVAGAAPAAPVGRGGAPAAAPTARASSGEAGAWLSWLKVAIAVGGAAGLMFWPWPGRCGAPLLGFTAATGAVAALGVWSAIGTWRHRLGLAHLASLLVTAWGLLLGAREVLPRVGYAVPSIERPAQWSCDGLPALPASAPGNKPGALPPGVTPGTETPQNGAPKASPNG